MIVRTYVYEVCACMCGSPVQKSKIIPSHISIATLCSKHRIAELPLRAGLMRTL